MASLNKHNGGWQIRFIAIGGKRRSFFPGKMPKKNAQQVKSHIEALVSAKQSGTAIPLATATWLNECAAKFRAKLHKLGLIEKPSEQSSQLTLKALCEGFIEGRVDVKDSSRLVWKRCQRLLLKCFAESTPIESFTVGDAKDFRQFLLKDGKAENTTRKMCSVASQFFADAVDREIIARNPFRVKSIPRTITANRKRDHFITREIADQVLEACPNAEWRLIFALARFGGLRCPSEIMSLQWDHVLWDQGRLIVPSPKTEHHEGKEERIIPLFPELRLHLEASYDLAEAGTVQVINEDLHHSNPGVKMKRIVEQAGIKPWPKTFHNLRATRETELAQSYPIHVVCEWIGNSAIVAMKHYLQVTDSDFEKASKGSHISDQKVTATGCKGVQGNTGTESKTTRKQGKDSVSPLRASTCTNDQWTLQDLNL